MKNEEREQILNSIVAFAKEIGQTDPHPNVEWISQAEIDEFYKVAVLSIAEMLATVSSDNRDLTLVASVLHLNVQNFILNRVLAQYGVNLS
jgi:hypothetical protein